MKKVPKKVPKKVNLIKNKISEFSNLFVKTSNFLTEEVLIYLINDNRYDSHSSSFDDKVVVIGYCKPCSLPTAPPPPSS
jgi:hypothetical protein